MGFGAGAARGLRAGAEQAVRARVQGRLTLLALLSILASIYFSDFTSLYFTLINYQVIFQKIYKLMMPVEDYDAAEVYQMY